MSTIFDKNSGGGGISQDAIDDLNAALEAQGDLVSGMGGDIARLGTFQGLARTVSKIENPLFNKMNANASASHVADGTGSQPNYIGWQTHLEQFTGGTAPQSAFVFDPGFDVDISDVANLVTYRLNLIQKSYGGNIPQQPSAYSVSKNGTELTFSKNSGAWDMNLYDAVVWVKGTEQDGTDPLILNFVSETYDAVTDSSGPQISIHSTHSASINNPGGHLTLGYGSYLFALEGCSYMSIGGTNIIATDFDTGVAFGQNLRVGGANSSVFGYNHSVDMDGVLVAGADHIVNTGNQLDMAYSTTLGRGAVPRMGNMLVIGLNNSLAPSAGVNQVAVQGRTGTSTSSAQAFLKPGAGSSLYRMAEDTVLAATVKLVFVSENGDIFGDMKGDVLFRRRGSGVVRAGTGALNIINSVGDVTGISAECAPAGTGFYVRFFGRDNETFHITSCEVIAEKAFSYANR